MFLIGEEGGICMRYISPAIRQGITAFSKSKLTRTQML